MSVWTKRVSHSVMSDSLQPHRLVPTRLLCPWDSPGNNTGVGCHALFQGVFPTQEPNFHLLLCRQILYCLSHQGRPHETRWDCKWDGGGGRRRGGGGREGRLGRGRNRPQGGNQPVTASLTRDGSASKLIQKPVDWIQFPGGYWDKSLSSLLVIDLSFLLHGPLHNTAAGFTGAIRRENKSQFVT